MQETCKAAGKVLVVYLSMAFGNPYGDPYDPALVDEFVTHLDAIGVQVRDDLWLLAPSAKGFGNISPGL
jgi:hypothetical protein